MPHCAPPSSTKARCSGWSPPSALDGHAPRARAPARAGTRHEQTGSPSSSTVQAPHSPSPQPSLVPVRPQVLAQRRRGGAPSAARPRRPRRPLSVSATGDATDATATRRAPPPSPAPASPGPRARRGRGGACAFTIAGAGPVHRQLAEALRAERRRRIRVLEHHRLHRAACRATSG